MLDWTDRHCRVFHRLLAPGALLSNGYVKPQLTATGYGFEFENDATYVRQIRSFLGEDADRYGIAVLDVTDPDNPIYADVNGGIRIGTVTTSTPLS